MLTAFFSVNGILINYHIFLSFYCDDSSLQTDKSSQKHRVNLTYNKHMVTYVKFSKEKLENVCRNNGSYLTRIESYKKKKPNLMSKLGFKSQK